MTPSRAHNERPLRRATHDDGDEHRTAPHGTAPHRTAPAPSPVRLVAPQTTGPTRVAGPVSGHGRSCGLTPSKATARADTASESRERRRRHRPTLAGHRPGTRPTACPTNPAGPHRRPGEPAECPVTREKASPANRGKGEPASPPAPHHNQPAYAAPTSRWRRSSASMNESRSPSSTASTFPVS